VWLQGYDLYSLGNYPYAVKSSDPTHRLLVEVVIISDPETEKTISKIELDAGYSCQTITIGDYPVTIFLFNEPTNNLRIDSGDWSNFFGQ
jgi:gamma-glutamylcyclotransferase (GGCT)/AIG2-like uncharacterized protein YtfP